MARQHIAGGRNITVGGNLTIKKQQTDKRRTLQPVDIVRLQGVQIALLVILVMLMVTINMRHSALQQELEDIRHMANRAMVVAMQRGGENGH